MSDPKQTKTETAEEKFAAAVREKVLAGLTKEQAIEVLKAQAEHDAKLAIIAAAKKEPAKA